MKGMSEVVGAPGRTCAEDRAGTGMSGVSGASAGHLAVGTRTRGTSDASGALAETWAEETAAAGMSEVPAEGLVGTQPRRM